MTTQSPGHTEKPSEWPFIGEEILVEYWGRRVRAMFNGAKLVDTSRAAAVIEWRHPRELARERALNHFWMSGVKYAFALDDLHMDHFHRSSETFSHPVVGVANYWSIQVRDRIVDWAAWQWEDPSDAGAELAGLMVVNHRAIDTMFEEETELPDGPRNPYHRVDVRESSRHVRVAFDGVTVAETSRPRIVYETGLPIRYYIPRQDVHMEHIRPSELTTSCPYKGEADFASVHTEAAVHENVAWQYVRLYADSLKLENTMCFWPERGAEIFLDGELLPPAQAPWPKKLLVKATPRTVNIPTSV